MKRVRGGGHRGKWLADLRREAGLTQAQLALAAGVCRDTVSRWERRAVVAWWKPGPVRLLEVLGVPVFSPSHTTTRRRGDGVIASLSQALIREDVRLAAREEILEARRRVLCGAKTRKGTSCRLLSEPGRQRCKFHGGKSRGPKTAEGRARIAEAQRHRWAAWREAQAPIG